MTTLTELKAYADKKRSEFPHHAEEIEDLYILASDEIEDGGSMMHEIDLCVESIRQITEDCE